MLNPFGMGNVRAGLGQQGSNQPYNFKGLEDRLGKLETGIAGLTDQFKNFQIPGQQTVDPIYTGGTEPNPLAPATPTGGISSLPEAQDTGSVPPPTGGIQSMPEAQAPGQSLSRTRGPLSPMEKLRNEYLTETGGPLTMGDEWDARAKEMGFDFASYGGDSRGQYLKDGEWTAAPVDWYSKGHEKYKPGGVSRMNQLFEEAGGVMDRPEHGAAARYGEGFTDWLGDKGYEVYTEKDYRTEPGYQRPKSLGELMGGPQQDMSWYTPHLSQYAMTAEEMQDPEGTLKARRNKLYQPSGNDVGGLPPGLEGPRGGIFGNAWDMSGGEYQPGVQQLQPYKDPSLMAAGIAGQPSGIQQLQPFQRALQAGIGALQGPTQQKIKQGYQV